jgi:phenylacetate-CoA ligase
MVLKSLRQDIYFDDIEERPVNARHIYLERKLRSAINHAYKHAPAAREIMEKARVKPADIHNVKSLVRLPIIRRNDLIERQKAAPPYGGFLAIKPEAVERVFISAGPLREPLHSVKSKPFAMSLWAAGFRKGDIVINAFNYNLSPEGMLVHEGLRQCGATVIPSGGSSMEMQIQTMRDLKVNGYAGTPSVLLILIKKAEEMELDFKTVFNLERAWFTGELLSPENRKMLEENYGIDTRQAYTVMEAGGAIAYECPQKTGLHLSDDYVVEIADPVTGNQLKPGDTGEIVVTPIDNKAWGLIRYGTGEMASCITERCACGRTAHRIQVIKPQ